MVVHDHDIHLDDLSCREVVFVQNIPVAVGGAVGVDRVGESLQVPAAAGTKNNKNKNVFPELS